MRPKPWIGDVGRLPATLIAGLPASTPVTSRERTGLAHPSGDRFSGVLDMERSSLCSDAGGGERLGFVGMDADRLVEAGQVEDLAVVLVQPVREQALLVAVRADEQGDEQADPARVHVLELREVEDDRSRTLAAGLLVGLSQGAVATRGDL